MLNSKMREEEKVYNFLVFSSKEMLSRLSLPLCYTKSILF